MTPQIEPTRILSISNNPLILDTIATAVREDTSFLMLDHPDLSTGIISAIENSHPDIVLLDYHYNGSENGYETVDKIAMQFPHLVIIVILPDSETQIDPSRLLLAGARGFLQYPFTQEKLISTLRRMVELILRSPRPGLVNEEIKKKDGLKNTVVVFSPKGGGGCTTVATNLAIALHQVNKEEVLLIDGKHMFGHVTLMLNLRTANSIADLIQHANSLDPLLIKQVLLQHISGIHVLASPLTIAEAQGIRPETLYKVILSLQNSYSNIIVDGGSYLNENTVTYMDAADYVVVVVNPNLASLRDVRQFLELSRNTLGYPSSKTLLVLNQAGRKSDVKVDEIERVLQTKLAGVIPADDNVAQGSLNDGVPIVLRRPNHDISKAYSKFAKQIVENIRLAKAEQNPTPALAQSSAPVKKSFFG